MQSGKKQPSSCTERTRISHQELEFLETVLFASSVSLNRVQRLYILIEQVADAEDLELVIDLFKDIKQIRDITKDFLEEKRAARSGKTGPPSKRKR